MTSSTSEAITRVLLWGLLCVVVIGGGASMGVASCIVAGSALKWVVVFLAALGLLAAIVFVKDRRRLALGLFAFCIPIFMAKRIYSTEYPMLTGGPSSLGLFLYDIPFILLLAAFLRDHVILRRRPTHIPSVLISFALYAFWCGLSIANSSNVPLSVIELMWVGKLALVVLVLANVIRDRDDLTFVLVILIGGLFFQEMATFAQKFFNVWFTVSGDMQETTMQAADSAEVFRAGGFVGPHNVQSAYYVLLIPLAFSLFLEAENLLVRVALFCTVGLGGVAVLFTYSRNGYLGLFVALAFTAVFAWLAGIFKKGDVLKLGLAGAWLGILVLLLFGKGLMDRITSMESVILRFETDRIALNMVKNHPVLGVGLNNFAIVMADNDYAPTGVSDMQQTFFGGDLISTVVHNRFLLAASETGLVGLFFYLLLVVGALAASADLMRLPDKLLRAIGAGLTAAFIGAAVQMLFDIYNSDLLVTIYWSLVGVALAARRIADEESGMAPGGFEPSATGALSASSVS
ncbi:MAG: O-antigen ligase family protein [Syntrophobacteraceae bacterium]